MTTEFFEEAESVGVPTPKRLYNKGLKKDPLPTTVLEMNPVFGLFPRVYGGARTIGGLEQDGFLRRGCDADIEGDFAPVDPIVDEDVRWPGESAGDKTWHFLLRIERCSLGGREDGVADTVVAARLHAAIVTAVEGVVSQFVLRDGAGGSAAVSGQQKWDA